VHAASGIGNQPWGTRPTAEVPAARFTGDVYGDAIYPGDGPSRMIVSRVRFTPGARTTGTPRGPSASQEGALRGRSLANDQLPE
jgi:hypothetical protein